MTDRQAWLEARRKGIGGSDVAAILGASQWAGPFDVWLDKTGQTALDSGETAPQKRGRLLEDAVAQWYEEETDYSVFRAEHAEGPEPWMLASPDRIVNDGTDKWGLECKTARYPDAAWGPDLAEATSRRAAEIMPRQYALQVAWYLEVCDRDRWDVAVLFMAADEFRRFTVHRDREFGAALTGHLRDWWQRHVLAGEPPALDGSKAAGAWLLSEHPHPKAPLRDATPEEESLLADYKAALDLETRGAAKREALEVKVKAAIGDSEGLACSLGRVTWLSQKGRETLDGKRLRVERPEVAKAYTKTGDPIRVLRKNWRSE